MAIRQHMMVEQPHPLLLAESALWLSVANKKTTRNSEWAVQNDWFGFANDHRTRGAVNTIAGVFTSNLIWWTHQAEKYLYPDLMPALLVQWVTTTEPYASAFAAGVRPFEPLSVRAYVLERVHAMKKKDVGDWITEWSRHLMQWHNAEVTATGQYIIDQLLRRHPLQHGEREGLSLLLPSARFQAVLLPEEPRSCLPNGFARFTT